MCYSLALEPSCPLYTLSPHGVSLLGDNSGSFVMADAPSEKKKGAVDVSAVSLLDSEGNLYKALFLLSRPPPELFLLNTLQIYVFVHFQ